MDLNTKEAAKVNQSILLMVSSCWIKEKIFWERGSIFVLTEKKKRILTSSKVIRIRFGRGRTPEDLGYRQEKEMKKNKLDR